MASGTLTAAGGTVTLAYTAGAIGSYVCIYGTYAGAQIRFYAKKAGVTGMASARNMSGAGIGHSWTLLDNTTYHFDLSESLTETHDLVIICSAITSGTINVNMISGTPHDVQALTYGTTVTPNPANGSYMTLDVTDTVAYTIGPPAVTPAPGVILTFEIFNDSGGTMGTPTFDAIYTLAGAFTKPASTKRRIISFRYNGTNYVEINRTAADM